MNLTSWKKRRPTLIDINFLGSSGNAPAKILTPLQYFKHFFGNELLEHITEQSNLYCIQQKVKHNLKCKQLDTTKNEIEQFIGVLLFMAYINCLSIECIGVQLLDCLKLLNH